MLLGAAEPALTGSVRRQRQPAVVDAGRNEVGCASPIAMHDEP
jgi:hypothetical protein